MLSNSRELAKEVAMGRDITGQVGNLSVACAGKLLFHRVIKLDSSCVLDTSPADLRNRALDLFARSFLVSWVLGAGLGIKLCVAGSALPAANKNFSATSFQIFWYALGLWLGLVVAGSFCLGLGCTLFAGFGARCSYRDSYLPGIVTFPDLLLFLFADFASVAAAAPDEGKIKNATAAAALGETIADSREAMMLPIQICPKGERFRANDNLEEPLDDCSDGKETEVESDAASQTLGEDDSDSSLGVRQKCFKEG
ncbi:hypothetical protein Acr_22g0005610 [Actinidia rufa]|uniref:Transmembrane protein n=1 Tax=Actinidia rufa TaxID=165716 RepID=A0A7J0GK31_9ERIC|nr:hypothetical protein Acr_22g0005610 [Actinidia rufa]